MPPRPVGDEGGRRPSEAQSAAGGSPLRDNAELRGERTQKLGVRK